MVIETRTTCPYCGVGCGVIARREDDGRLTVKGDPDHPANLGRLCSKGSALAETTDLDGRLLTPQVNGKPADWEVALDLVARRFSETIAAHGPDSVAFYVSGQILTEDYYVANKLMKGFIGSANIDTNSRLCMSSSVAGHRRALGSVIVPGTYEDIELADLVILTGSNLAWCHPVIYQRLAAAKQARPQMKVVVIDPRRTMTCDIADLHLAIRPDGDVALFMGLLAHLAKAGRIDEGYVGAHTLGFAQAFDQAAALSFADLIEATGLPAMQIRDFFRMFEGTDKVVTCYSQGVNQSQSGTDKVNAIINCHLATGRIGRPGMGPFSLTGQPNAMGGREVGGLANMLAAHMSLEDAVDRDRVQRFWQSPVIANAPGLKAVDLFRAVADGRVKAIWIMATNPVVSLPEADRVRDALAACPFVVVSDLMVETDTTSLAHVLLPSLGWGEKDGTVTNSERRISRQRGFLDTPGTARPDWWQMTQVARRMGFTKSFAWETAGQIFAEHASLSAFENQGSRDFDIGALANLEAHDYDALSPVQWPQPDEDALPPTRFFADGRFYFPDGKARFVAVSVPATVVTPGRYTLNTGRVRDHWHTMTRTGKSARLSAHIAEPFVEIHPADAAELGIRAADLVDISSIHGRSVVRALLTPRQMRGNLFAPIHWNDQFAAKARIASVIAAVTDPVSGQPASKMAAVDIKRYPAEWYGFAVCVEQPQAIDADYWALAKADGGWRVELAGRKTPEDWTAWARRTLHVPPEAEPIVYRDQAKGAQRLAFSTKDRLFAVLFLAKEPVEVARSYVVSLLANQAGTGRLPLSAIAGRAGAGGPDKGAIICSCMSVGIHQIVDAIRTGCTSVEMISQKTAAGTNCGSCRAEIREIIDGSLAAAAE